MGRVLARRSAWQRRGPIGSDGAPEPRLALSPDVSYAIGMLLKFLVRQACIALTIVSAHEASARIWTEAGTAKKIEADFVSADAESVVIVSAGKRFSLPLARLSPEDQAFVRQQLAQKASPAEKPSKTKAE